MSEMVERVAAAMVDADFDVDSWRHVDENMKDRLRAMARAAIAAMREPTEAMVASGLAENGRGAGTYEDYTLDAWQAMIDEALK